MSMPRAHTYGEEEGLAVALAVALALAVAVGWVGVVLRTVVDAGRGTSLGSARRSVLSTVGLWGSLRSVRASGGRWPK